jgi:hypothetical protein
MNVEQGLAVLLRNDANTDDIKAAFDIYANEQGFMDLPKFIVSFSIITAHVDVSLISETFLTQMDQAE